PVAQDRPAEGGAVLLGDLGRPLALLLLDRTRCAPVVRGTVPEEAALELIAARARHRGHRRAADLVVLGLVVGGDDLVFADRRLRERVAAAVILRGHAARGDVVLLANAVDEDVDVVRSLRAAAKLRLRT